MLKHLARLLGFCGHEWREWDGEVVEFQQALYQVRWCDRCNAAKYRRLTRAAALLHAKPDNTPSDMRWRIPESYWKKGE